MDARTVAARMVGVPMCPMHVNETITPLQAWKAVLATFLLLGRLIRGARILGGAYWGPEDFSEIRAQLIPLLQAVFALLIQASSVVFSRVQFDEETPHRMRHWGEEGAILIETTNGQKVQMEYCRIDFEDEPWVPKPCFFPSLV